MVFNQNNQLEPRYGVRDSCNKAIIRSNRQRLRAWLATNIPTHSDKAATTLEEGADSITVHFKDNTSAKGDIVVGADGVSSMVRQYLVNPDPVHVLPIAIVVGAGVLSGRDFERQLELGYSLQRLCGERCWREGGWSRPDVRRAKLSQCGW
jgi:2-polyprenyl-6-methoxyphenol hydroxylase-like FAD-dependent oxidoreductase